MAMYHPNKCPYINSNGEHVDIVIENYWTYDEVERAYAEVPEDEDEYYDEDSDDDYDDLDFDEEEEYDEQEMDD